MSKSQFQRRSDTETGTQNVVTANHPDLSKLPRALARATQEGWLIAPVAAHSKHASLARSCLLEPSNFAAEIVYWANSYPNANYCVVTGAESRLAILEVNHASQDLLCDLCNDT